MRGGYFCLRTVCSISTTNIFLKKFMGDFPSVHFPSVLHSFDPDVMYCEDEVLKSTVALKTKADSKLVVLQALYMIT
jgi:hypothetical protein